MFRTTQHDPPNSQRNKRWTSLLPAAILSSWSCCPALKGTPILRLQATGCYNHASSVGHGWLTTGCFGVSCVHTTPHTHWNVDLYCIYIYICIFNQKSIDIFHSIYIFYLYMIDLYIYIYILLWVNLSIPWKAGLKSTHVRTPSLPIWSAWPAGKFINGGLPSDRHVWWHWRVYH